MEPALAYFSIRSGRMPSDANMTTLSTGRPSSFFAPAAPAPIIRTTNAAAPQSAVASQRRPRFMCLPPSPLVKNPRGQPTSSGGPLQRANAKKGWRPLRAERPPNGPLVVQVLRLLGREHGREVIHRCVARAQRLDPEPMLDRRDDRRRVVLGAVDGELVLQVRREDQRRD